MTPIDRFERQLPMALTDLAAPRTPEYLTDILGRTARTRQRPAWASIERWLPMQIATSRVMTTRMPWRQLGALALIALLLAVAIAAYVGSQQSKLPQPFGQAANGSIVFSKDGDIVAADLATGDSKIIVGGPERDVDPTFSLDGTRLLFARQTENNTTKATLYVARADGSGLKPLTAKPIIDPHNWSFSPDGRWVTAFAIGDQGGSIVVIPSDGSAGPTYYPVFATRDDTPPQFRPDGSEILFIGQDPAQAWRGVYALVLATGQVRPVVAPMADMDIHGASLSPDGRHVAYGTFDPNGQGISARTHVVGVDGSGDVAVDTDPDSTADAGTVWSNDGTRLVIGRFYGQGPTRSAVVPIDRSGPGVVIECPPGAPVGDCGADWVFSPDDSVLIATLPSGAHVLADPLTGKVRAAAWTGGRPSWQRLAPAQ